MKSILIIIGFIFAFLVVYLGYRMDKREEMHLRKIHMAKEKKFKSNKKQIEGMISKFTNVINAKTKAKEDSDVLTYEEAEESPVSVENEENVAEESTDIEDTEIREEDLLEDISVNDIDINDIDIEDVIIDEEPAPLDDELDTEETIRTYTESENDDDDLEDFIKTIHIDEPERENLKTSSKDIVASLVKEYDYDAEEDETGNSDTIDNNVNSITDLDENSEVETFMDIINPRRYTRKKAKSKEIKKNIKRYTRKKTGRKSKKKTEKRYFSTGVVLSRKPRIKESSAEKIQIEDINDTNEYVDYKEILNIIEPVGIKDEKNVEVVTVNISDIEPFMPKRDVVQKRGRGRPRKEITEIKPKRGRGRPRKEITEIKPKRKRGRPRKDEAVEQEQ